MTPLFGLLKKSYPLRVHISTLFLVLVLCSCGALSFLFYDQSGEVVETEVEKRLGRILRESTTEFERIMIPPAVAVNLISRHQLVEAPTVEQRFESVPFLIEAMKAGSNISSLFVGYQNGDFFMLRRIGNDKQRQFFDTPIGTSWLIQSIDQEGSGSVKKHFSLDESGELISDRSWETDYDPRSRTWYSMAVGKEEMVRSEPYLFYTDQKIGMTFSKGESPKSYVIGADVRLETLSGLTRNHKLTPNTQVVLFDSQSQLIAYQDAEKLVKHSSTGADTWERGVVGDLELPALDQLIRIWAESKSSDLGKVEFKVSSKSWVATVVQLDLDTGPPVFLALAIPYNELMAEVRQIMTKATLFGLAVLLALIPLTLGIARGIARPLNKLADDADNIRRFDFSEVETVRSYIKEVDELASTTGFMKKTISDFLALLESVNREKNFDSLLGRLAEEARKAADAEGVCVYLYEPGEEMLYPADYSGSTIAVPQTRLPAFSIEDDNPLVAAVKNKTVTSWYITDAAASSLKLLKSEDSKEITLTSIPLRGRQGEKVLGAVCLFHSGAPEKLETSDYKDRLIFVEHFSEFAGVTLQTKRLFEQQKALFESFVDLIIEAIDAKSPYTGEHCQRVPIIASMLAQAVCDEQQGIFSDYSWDEDEWEELRVAAKLHDCGKITTPEYVVDKATKLETIYDRIHEIRMRFEVLRRDGEIQYWKKMATGESPDQLLSELEKINSELTEDYAFIATCNEGGEFMAEDAVERLHNIAEKRWQRTFDDRLGISWQEGKRKERTSPGELPVVEKLIDDKEEHLITRTGTDHIETDNPWGFKLEEPQHLYNRGELYNLEVKRGTLSNEERYKINDHIVQTIKMLSALPFPDHLRGVPEIAGGHHETMNGSGYPRKLSGEQMSMRARIMVIADVFEALTASGRPYKKAKKLSEAIKIMGFMYKDDHFDGDLFRLFLSSGIYREYAEKYLDKDQIDEVAIEQYL